MNKNLIFAISTLLVFVLAACSSTASATPSEAPASTTAPLDTNTAISSTAVESTPIPPTAASTSVSFAKDILPIFNQNCTACHGGRGGLSLNSYDQVMSGGISGAAIVPGKPDESLLVQRMTGAVSPQMPKGGSALSQDLIDKISQWIKDGAANN